MAKGLSQAKAARMYILEKMKETISASRTELSKYAPRLIKITIDPDKIRNVIGSGGKTIRSIMSEAKVTIDIEDNGTILIGSPNEEATQKAIKMIEDLTRDVEVGAIYNGRVTRLASFGAFVEILPGKEGLVHLSELADYPAPSVEEVVKVGDEVMVVVTEIDRMGRVNLSRRAVFQKLSQVPGANAGTEQKESPSYPFKKHADSRPPSHRPRGEGGEPDARRLDRERPKGVTHKRPPDR